MAGLKSLIRLKRHQLDERRRTLNELLKQDDMLAREIHRLEDELVKEREFARENFEATQTYAAYLKRNLDRQKIIEVTRIKLNVQIEKAQSALQDSFKEIKTLEITESERARKKRAKLDKQERDTLDDIGLETYRRRKAEEN